MKEKTFFITSVVNITFDDFKNYLLLSLKSFDINKLHLSENSLVFLK
jgi:hypothetical protein